jgi:beta-lactam-binding protein with PASTA domain
VRVAPPAPAPFTPAKPKRPVWPWIVGLALVAAVVVALWLAGAFTGNVTVPDLNGMTLDEARTTLSDVGLELGDLTNGEGKTGVPQGTVVDQSPAAGDKVDEGSAVDLVVAGAPNVVMPDLVGLSQAEAEAAVTAAGLIVERVITVYSSDTPAGKVADQTPSAGTTVAQGTPVTISVSAGPQTSPSPGATAVPDVTGKTQDEALSLLEAGGFSAVVTTQASTTVPAGQVISQNPKGGVLATPGTSVTLVVSTGTASPSP